MAAARAREAGELLVGSMSRPREGRPLKVKGVANAYYSPEMVLPFSET